VEFYGTVLMMLAAPVKRYGCGEMSASVFLLYFLRNLD
jgi:hypothetical protein